MELKSISIKDDAITIKAVRQAGTTIAITSDKICRSEFGEAVKGLAVVAGGVLKHDAELMAVRSVAVSVNKKGVEFVKLGGVLASQSKDGEAKPGRFTTGKIEVKEGVRLAMKAMTDEAQEYMRLAMA